MASRHSLMLTGVHVVYGWGPAAGRVGERGLGSPQHSQQAQECAGWCMWLTLNQSRVVYVVC